ncbi:hypothetical protein LBMAG40_12200 [Cyanobium sp.]|nr:hypothetical protein LBMAG40_12200 [Cyanobium sp.]
MLAHSATTVIGTGAANGVQALAASLIQEHGTAGSGAELKEELLITIDDVQKALNRSRASVYRYTNTDPPSLNSHFHLPELNPDYCPDHK